MNDEAIPASLKWGKTCYDDELMIVPGSSSAARDLKLRVQSLTGVPPGRQKLLCPKAWKGALKDDDDIIIPGGILRVPTKKEGKSKSKSKSRRIIVTLIGSSESLEEKPPEERPRFEEDMTPEELWRATTRRTDGDDDDGVVVDIVALQKEPGMERDDGKMEMYEYNRFVTGLPQHQINDMLASRSKKEKEASADYRNNQSLETTLSSSPPLLLLGEVAMTMGAELRRSYVNSLAVLRDGTLVSGLEDGHVQLWRRGRMVKDARHPGSAVDRVLAFPSSSSASSDDDDDDDDDGPSFATAGDGGLCLWTKGGGHLLRLGSYPGTTPASIAAGAVVVDGGDGGSTQYLAACFRVTRQVDPNRFRLVPQNDAERRRRLVAEAEERTIQNELLRVVGCIRIWFYNSRSRGGTSATVRDIVVPPEETMETAAAPITELLDVEDGMLACGDAWGCIRTLELAETTGGLSSNNNDGVPSVSRRHLLQFRGYGIACMERVGKNVLAVSIEANRHAGEGILASAVPLNATTRPYGIYIVDLDGATVRAILDAHTDTVRSICPLPDGSLMSAGGKMDATVRVWDDPLASTTIENLESNYDEEAKIVTEARVMKEPGYVFDLKVLPDARGSNAYAIAAARYNVVKIVI